MHRLQSACGRAPGGGGGGGDIGAAVDKVVVTFGAATNKESLNPSMKLSIASTLVAACFVTHYPHCSSFLLSIQPDLPCSQQEWALHTVHSLARVFRFALCISRCRREGSKEGQRAQGILVTMVTWRTAIWSLHDQTFH